MKARKTFGSVLILIILMIGAVAANGQGINSYKGNIPFDFSVGKKVFTAGDYVIRFGDVTKPATVFTLEDANGKEVLAKVVRRTGRTASDADCDLVFGRYGDEYVLQEMRAPLFAFEAPKVRTATWVQITKNSSKPEIVTIAMAR